LVTRFACGRRVVEPARREGAVEMKKPGNEDFHHRDADIGAGLVEYEEIEALLLDKADAGLRLSARVETGEFGRRSLDRRAIAGNQIGVILWGERVSPPGAGFCGGGLTH